MFAIDTRSREPIYTQLEKQIVRNINLGILEKDSALPSVRSLACELGINPNTVAKAYRELEQKGIIYTIQGKGAFVSLSGMEEVHQTVISDLQKHLEEVKNSAIAKNEVIELVNNIWEGKRND